MKHLLAALFLIPLAQTIAACPLATAYGLPADKGAGAILCNPAHKMPAPQWRYDLHKGVEDISAALIPLPDNSTLVLGYAQNDQEPLGWALRLDAEGVNQWVAGGNYTQGYIAAAAFHPDVGLIAARGSGEVALLNSTGKWQQSYDFGRLFRNESRVVNDVMFAPDGHLYVLGAERDTFGVEFGVWDLSPGDYKNAFMTEFSDDTAAVKLLRVGAERENITVITTDLALSGTQTHAIASIDWQGNIVLRVPLSDYGRYLDAIALPNGGYAALAGYLTGDRWVGSQRSHRIIVYDAALNFRHNIALTDPGGFHATAMMATDRGDIILAGHLTLEANGTAIQRPGIYALNPATQTHIWRAIDIDADVHFTQIAQTADDRILLAGMRGTKGAQARDTDATVLSWPLADILGTQP